jgi:hypothetical protein
MLHALPCRLTLSQFNPLLEEVVLIRESGQLMTSIAPAEGRLPAEHGQVGFGVLESTELTSAVLSNLCKLSGL